MEMTLRWYGPGYDSVTLEQIRQIPGVHGVVRLHFFFLCRKSIILRNRGLTFFN